jgi:hypothetical protein
MSFNGYIFKKFSFFVDTPTKLYTIFNIFHFFSCTPLFFDVLLPNNSILKKQNKNEHKTIFGHAGS